MTELPIDEVLPQIRAALAGGNRLVLAAPPGAGKTTRAPLDLLGEGWLADKRILLLEPRRIAARMAAERMAETLGERTGETVGLSTRVDRRVSAKTRIEVVTDGLFTRRILADPGLDGVGAVLFDEFHERSLNLDLGLALALDAQTGLRPDLRLLIMSATLDTARVAAALGAPVVESRGRQFDVETRYLGRGDGPLEDRMAAAIRRALAAGEGDVLAFLPGRGEILRTAERLGDLPQAMRVAPLYGALSPAEQDAAVRPAPPGARKVILATDIAESALTIAGVRIVVDAGLARVAEHDGVGATLATRRAARANVDQRRGRAGRTAPGLCFRLWDEAETRGLKAEPDPEIRLAELSGLALALAEWGVREARDLVWLDPPAEGRLAAAREELHALGALDAGGRITEKGKALAVLPLTPALAALVLGAEDAADRALAAEIAALVGERGLGGAGVDLRERIERFRRDRSPRAEALRRQAARWAGTQAPGAPAADAGRVLARAAPATIARRRPGTTSGMAPGATQGALYLLASGRAGRLDAADPLSKQPWIVVADAAGAPSAMRILAAAPIDEADALALGGVAVEDNAAFDPETRTLRARRIRRLGAITLSETPLPAPSADAARAALVEAVRGSGFALLAEGGAAQAFLARIAIARRFDPALPEVTEADAMARAEEWLSPLLGTPPSLDRPRADEIARGLAGLLDRDAARRVEALAPAAFETPAGRRLLIDYEAEGGPRIEARVQEFYGLSVHPAIARGALPLAVSLLSPAHRQVALTKDLPGFWRGGYRDMAKDMRGQYPKHDWPDDPAAAKPHAGKTKARLRDEDV